MSSDKTSADLSNFEVLGLDTEHCAWRGAIELINRLTIELHIERGVYPNIAEEAINAPETSGHFASVSSSVASLVCSSCTQLVKLNYKFPSEEGSVGRMMVEFPFSCPATTSQPETD